MAMVKNGRKERLYLESCLENCGLSLREEMLGAFEFGDGCSYDRVTQDDLVVAIYSKIQSDKEVNDILSDYTCKDIENCLEKILDNAADRKMVGANFESCALLESLAMARRVSITNDVLHRLRCYIKDNKENNFYGADKLHDPIYLEIDAVKSKLFKNKIGMEKKETKKVIDEDQDEKKEIGKHRYEIWLERYGRNKVNFQSSPISNSDILTLKIIKALYCLEESNRYKRKCELINTFSGLDVAVPKELQELEMLIYEVRKELKPDVWMEIDAYYNLLYSIYADAESYHSSINEPFNEGTKLNKRDLDIYIIFIKIYCDSVKSVINKLKEAKTKACIEGLKAMRNENKEAAEVDEIFDKMSIDCNNADVESICGKILKDHSKINDIKNYMKQYFTDKDSEGKKHFVYERITTLIDEISDMDTWKCNFSPGCCHSETAQFYVSLHAKKFEMLIDMREKAYNRIDDLMKNIRDKNFDRISFNKIYEKLLKDDRDVCIDASSDKLSAEVSDILGEYKKFIAYDSDTVRNSKSQTYIKYLNVMYGTNVGSTFTMKIKHFVIFMRLIYIMKCTPVLTERWGTTFLNRILASYEELRTNQSHPKKRAYFVDAEFLRLLRTYIGLISVPSGEYLVSYRSCMYFNATELSKLFLDYRREYIDPLNFLVKMSVRCRMGYLEVITKL